MTHYAMIDNYSGFFWGNTNADTPIEACQNLDEEIGTAFPVEYEETSASSLGANETGYHVYELPSDFDMGNGDGRSKELIDRISDLYCVATVRCTRIID